MTLSAQSRRMRSRTVDLVTGRTIRVTGNRSLLLLSRNAFVTSFAVHPPAARARFCGVWVVTKPTSIDISVCGILGNDKLAHQGNVSHRRTWRLAAVALRAARGWNGPIRRRRRLVIMARQAGHAGHAAVVHH